MEMPTKEELFEQHFLSNYITEQVARGFKIVPLLDMQSTDADTYTFYSEKETPEAAITAGRQKLPRKVAEGAELEIIRTSGLTADSVPVQMRGYRLKVENKKLKQNGQSILRFIRRLSYGLGRQIESDAVTTLIANATGTAASIATTWDLSTTIDLDVILMQDAYEDPSTIFSLTDLFANKTNRTEARTFLSAKYPGQTIPREPDINGSQLRDGGVFTPEGSLIGMDRNNPPATMIYGSEEGASTADVFPGMEGYSPLINVLVTDQTGKKIPAATDIYMAAITAVAVEDPVSIVVNSV